MLIRLSDEHVQLKGYITLKIISGMNANTNMIKVKYLVVDAPSSYNIIMGRYTINLLGVVLSTLYLSMKYLLRNKQFGIIQGDQETSQECY